MIGPRVATSARTVIIAAALGALIACEGPADWPDAGRDAGRADANVAPRDPPYVGIVDLHDMGIARTCSLNNGVCHNSFTYPDLRTPSSLIASATLPCGLSAVAPDAIPNECETPGDRLAIPALGFEAEVIWSEPVEIDETWGTVATVVLELGSDVPAIPTETRGFEIHRGDRVLPLLPEANLRIESIEGRRITLRITHYLGGSLESFFDTRRLAYRHEGVIRVADANHDGVHGNVEPHRLFVPGQPLESYIVMRLFDTRFGELMPRQCRTWNDEATRALACWIEGLETDASGRIANAYDPIDYDGCEVELPRGRCGSVTGTGFPAVQDVVARSCGGMGCHIGEDTPAAGLDLSAESARTSLMGMSTQRPERALVVPGEPDASYLVCKLSETCDARGTTARMPLGGMLSTDDLEIVRAWIASGAP